MGDEKKEKAAKQTDAQEKQEKNQKTENNDKKEVEAQLKTADVKDAPAETTKEKEDESPKKSTINIGDLSFLSEVRTDLPEIKPGDVLRVFYRVVEGGKERTQVFEGTVIAIKNRGITKTITVRKTSFGIAVERIFPLNSKLVQKIEVKKHSKVRRAKLYYLRELKGKAARLKELR
jgi:large subunit ribosomal protein L19